MRRPRYLRPEIKARRYTVREVNRWAARVEAHLDWYQRLQDYAQSISP